MSKNKDDAFDSFQLEEYKNISESHYESLKQISTFFQYYLLTLGAPAFILSIIAKKETGMDDFFKGLEMPIYYDFVFYYFIAISFVGYFIYLYVINLRLDALLYAKTVNKVRRYFYEKSSLDIDEYSSYAHLPLSSAKPKYSEKTFFVPLLLVFSLINCSMLLSAFLVKRLNSQFLGTWIFDFDFPMGSWLIFVSVFSLFILHICSYFYLAKRRNEHYLKSYSVGVDIDGVLNDQTEKFAGWLSKYTGKTLDKTKLKELPVSLNMGIGITDYEEKLIFNTREYWESLEMKPMAAKRINELHKRFGLDILIFSYRAWPQYGSDESMMREQIASKKFTPLEKGDIARITEKWLNDNGIESIVVNRWYKRVVYFFLSILTQRKSVILEIGNPYISDTRFYNNLRKDILNKNRFQAASLKGFKYFVDDSPENAIKLSSLCDYVFLFDEPYNQDENYKFSKNVIRVKSWDDIYRYMKSLN